MDPQFPTAQKKLVYETLLRYGVAPEIARPVAMVELRNFPPRELEATLQRLNKRGPSLRSFDFTPQRLLSRFSTLLNKEQKPYWLKPPAELLKGSADEGLALCFNSTGDWDLRDNDYFAISHVWEEGIQADPLNRGIPLPHVQQIIARIRQTGAEWIWLDGLAIPGSSRSLTLAEEEIKIAVINNLANIYSRARAVIIFDAQVMQLRSTNPLDVAICLACGKWTTRVWTFQEIYLAKKSVIITATGVVDFVDMARRLRALSANDGHLPAIFGSTTSSMDRVRETEKDQAKYEELYLTMVRHLGVDGKKPSLAQLAMVCSNRRTGNDVDYARAFFPVLGLTWMSHYTREEGMRLIYEEQKYYAKRLLLMHQSPRTLIRPGWAPSYLTGLTGRPIGPDHPLGDIEWEKRGLRRKWFTYKIQAQLETPPTRPNGLLLELTGEGTGATLCGFDTSWNERNESIKSFQEVIARGSAYILSNQILTYPSKNGLAYVVLCVERNEEVPEMDEAWVYLTAEATGMNPGSIPANTTEWLILHESPIGTHDQSGKAFSKIARLLSDEKMLHEDQRPLHIAAETGDEATLQQLLLNNSKARIEARDKRGWTPLHTAAFKGHCLAVRLLLENGASVDSEDSSERSPLMLAADEGHADVVKELLQHGANVNFSRPNAWSPLNQALMRSHTEVVRILLDAGASPHGQDQFGFAPLLIACKDVQLANLLIDAGADPNADLVGGATVLHFAARAGNSALIEHLLNRGIPVDLPEGDPQKGITPLYRAVTEQQEAAVATLLQHGANPNHPLETGWTCVLHAVKLGHFNITKMLIDYGADSRTVCRPEGFTALHIASREGHQLIAKLLVTTGWDVNARDSTRGTPLQLAQAAGHASIVDMLAKAGGV